MHVSYVCVCVRLFLVRQETSNCRRNQTTRSRFRRFNLLLNKLTDFIDLISVTPSFAFCNETWMSNCSANKVLGRSLTALSDHSTPSFNSAGRQRSRLLAHSVYVRS